MASNRPVKIAYSGTLDAFEPGKSNQFLSSIKNWFWTYQQGQSEAGKRKRS